ncbi:unnamed protein product [Trifolium pratense]|uniref:Uncharacterized protein n=1 Tax=Trifolium pratense TaxID=57577 RepID=A0ACB0MD17_TRIPR|nr:unnamed protein product [Trifolium pratense]
MNLDFVFTTNSTDQYQAKKPPDINKPSSSTISFRDKLMGSNTPLPAREKEDMIANKTVRIEHKDGNRLFPMVHLDSNVFLNMCTPWKDALVVTLLGKRIGYNSMKDRLQKIWKLQGGFEIMNNDNGFYMVKFDSAADKERVISDGPWMILDHYLAVSHWSPEFASPDAKVERTVVWIRFPGLNLVYYDESFLLAMASAIGRPIKVDKNTLNVERGRFARVCVEVDLTLPVVGKIWLNGHWYKVQYEGLHIICTSCGCYGHLSRNCKKKPQTPSPLPPSSSSQQNTKAPTADTSSSNAATLISPIIAPINVENIPNKEPIIEEINEDIKSHGEWLTVTRRRKNQAHGNQGVKNTNTNSKNIKNVNLPKQSNPSHNNLAHNTNIAKHNNQTLPPRPRASEISRNNNSSLDPKRRRQDSEHVPAISLPTPINNQAILPVPILKQPVKNNTTTTENRRFIAACEISTR